MMGDDRAEKVERVVLSPYGYGKVVSQAPQRVEVALDWGATLYVQPTLLTDTILIGVKTFHADRNTLTFKCNIAHKLESLFEQVSKEIGIPTGSIKLIYPMAYLRHIKPHDTPRALKLPREAKFIALVQHKFTWDASSKGSNIELLNSSLTAVKRSEEDYESVLGTVGLSYGKHHWEVRLDNYVNDEDVFIGVAHKDVSLYQRPPDTQVFWGYLCTG